MEYIAFGEVLFEEHSSSFSSPYLFNGKELDRETNLSYYGARYLDMKTSLWLSVDPKSDKYPNISSYAYCFNNPLNVIDPDGREGIVVSGQHGGTMKSREHFLINGLDRVKGALKHRQSKSEGVTWIVYNDGSQKYGYTKTELAKYEKLAKKSGGNNESNE